MLTPTQPICLVKRVNDLILVARNEARLEALAKRLTSQTERLVTPLRADLRVKAERKGLSGGHGGAVISREIRIVAAVRWSVWLVGQRFEAGSNCILSAPCECSPATKANVQPKYATSTMR